jgi:hypothetical protein
MKPRALVIGAGPAGLMSAVAAAESGYDVTVLEYLPKPGAKLLSSGGGRCNLTNVLDAESLARRFGRQWRFMLPALNALPPEALREWFELRGVATEVTDGFHVFPSGGRAGDILKALLYDCERLSVRVVTGVKIEALWTENGVLKGVPGYPAEKVVVATGGKGYPELGSLGIGYRLAAQAGHDIVPPLPGLVGVRTVEELPHLCTGHSMKDASVCIDLPKFRGEMGRGELLFTHRGISGPAVLDLSADIAGLLEKMQEVPLKVNLFASRSRNDWLEEFARWQRNEGRKSVKNLLAAHLTQSMAELICRETRNDGVPAAEFTAAGRDALAALLTAMPLRVNATEGWRKAMVTRGGVALKKVDPGTLQSRLLTGLYFAGEVLDLDGPCGGYNLQWAFSSGQLAGRLTS